MEPLVSVIVPNYNHARFLPRRIESIHSQTWKNTEILFLDDCSTDDSLAVFRSLSHPKPVRQILNQTNSGSPFRQWAKGIQEARGEWVWIAETDDYAEPELLETLLAEARRNPRLALIYAESQIINEHDEPRGILSERVCKDAAPRWRMPFQNNGRAECLSYLLKGNTIPNASAAIFRRSAFHGIEQELASYRNMGDWVAYMHILRSGDIAFTSRVLNHYRIHEANQSRGEKALRNSFGEQVRGTGLLVQMHRLRPGEQLTAAAELVEFWYYLHFILDPLPPPSARISAFLGMAEQSGIPLSLFIIALVHMVRRRASSKLKPAHAEP